MIETTIMIDILFVDDEPNILAGLQRMLRSMRHEWKMSFANGGTEALEILSTTHVDVIVSDMKMPGMDGAQLFDAVREKFPQIVRIILSGYSEKEMIMKSVGSAHRYLSKPCDPDQLKSTVNKVCGLRKLLSDAHLRELVSQLPTVPSLPLLYSDLVEELSKPEPSSKKVGQIIKQDIGMTVKILHLVNSAFFGRSRRITDSNEAVDFLGLDTIGSLTLGLGVISQFESQTSAAFFAELWEHSVSVGLLAFKIASGEDKSLANDAFTAGLLHDLGKVVLAVNLPQEYTSVINRVRNAGISWFDAERQVFDATHPEVGAYLAGLWGLPTAVVEAIAFHDSPSEAYNTSFTPLTAVHAAHAILHVSSQSESKPGEPPFDLDYLNDLGLSEKAQLWAAKQLTIV